MRLKFTNKIVLLFALMISTAMEVSAQDFTQIFKAPEKDAEAYLNNYIGPGMLSFANGMAGGWYNTAKPHKPLGFDLTVTVNVANIPKAERSFLFNSGDYDNIQLSGGGSAQLPTLAGGEPDEQLALSGKYEHTDGKTYVYTSDSFDAPKGLDVEQFPIAGVPVPLIQLGIGVIKNTDIKIRYGNLNRTFEGSNNSKSVYSVNLFGLGVMHDFKQWIPAIKHLPIDMSVFVGFSRFKARVDIDVNKDVSDPSSVGYVADGFAEMTSNTTTIQALISKKLSILTPYIGIGYNAVGSGIKVKGKFTNNNLRDTDGNPTSLTLTDPVDLTFGGGSSLRTTLGMRIKLAVLTLHADYTLQKYNMLTVGVGISFR